MLKQVISKTLLICHYKINYIMKRNNILLIILLVLIACVAGFFTLQTKEKPEIKMTGTGDKEIDNLIIILKKSMEDYMKETSPSYSQNDIDECADLLSKCTINIFKTRSKDDAMSVVKSTVLKLNALNEKCDLSLIETNEREQIIEIIILAGHKMKYNSINEDITEKWREW